MKRIVLTSLIICCLGISSFAEANSTNTITGKDLNIEITTGLQGSFSLFQIGINFPQFIDHFLIGLKIREMSSLTWATFIDEQTKESVSFHPVVIAGLLSFGGTGNLINNSFRTYGACELLIGYSFTPYDSMIYDVDNLIGNNLTLGVFGTYGIEYFTSPKSSIFIESGGGFKTIKGDSENSYVIASSWLGSGVTFRMGAKIYFK